MSLITFRSRCFRDVVIVAGEEGEGVGRSKEDEGAAREGVEERRVLARVLPLPFCVGGVVEAVAEGAEGRARRSLCASSFSIVA